MTVTDSAAAMRPSPSTLWAAGALGILATAVTAILPVLMGVWQKQAGLQVDQAGLVAATELFAQVAGTGAFLWASPRWTLRRIGVVGLCVMIVGNIATAASVDFASLIAARVIGGAGGGLIRALCMMSLAKALSPGRAFAVYAGAQVGLAAVTTALMPHFIDAHGARAPFLVLTLASVLGFALCPLLPRQSPLPTAIRHPGRRPYPIAAILAIAALFIFFAGQGALWTYLAPIGAYQSIPAAGVTQALALLNVAGLAGALGVGALAHRLNPRIALVTLLATEIAAIVLLFNVHHTPGFIASAGVFYFSWCASFPFQFTVIARSDSSGRASAVVPAADGSGLAGGAAIASVVLPTLGLASAVGFAPRPAWSASLFIWGRRRCRSSHRACGSGPAPRLRSSWRDEMSRTSFINAKIFDGTGSDYRDESTVVVENDRIVAVERQRDVAGAGEVIDVRGKTLMPGLIDAHCHVLGSSLRVTDTEAQPLTYVASYASQMLGHALDGGFTTLRDVGGGDIGIARAVEDRLIKGPRVFFAGRVLSMTGGHGDFRDPFSSIGACACSADGAGAMGYVLDHGGVMSALGLTLGGMLLTALLTVPFLRSPSVDARQAVATS